MRIVRSIVISSLLLAACAAPSSPSVSRTSQAVIGGEDSPTGVEDSVVLLYHLNRQDAGGCTGTLVAPNLVLTALHCVAETDASSACDSEGNALYGGKVGKLHAAKELYVFTGNVRPDFYSNERPDVAAKGAKIFAPDTDTMCNSDIALILLDQNVEGAVVSPLRLDGPTVSGETVTSVGWGITDKTASPETRKRRLAVPITSVGPGDPGRGRSLGPSEFEVGESICSGDSGGPAFASETGAVLGVVSRGGNGREPSQRDPAAGCVGDDAYNIYTGVAGHKDLILSAFAEAGYEAWLENELNGNLAEFGAECTAATECQQSVCAQTEGDTSTCNLDCTDTDCPEGYECTTGDADAQICTLIPPPAEEANADADDGNSRVTTGCAVTGAPHDGSAPGLGLGLGFAALAVLGRRRSRASTSSR